MSKIAPSDQQVEVADYFVKHSAEAPSNHHCKVEFEMDDHGAMYVLLTEDSVTQTALFDRSGSMYGDWF